jgi:hypothetical protein
MAFHGDRSWSEGVFAYNDYGTEDKTGNVALKPPFRGLPYLVSEAVGVEAVKPQHFSWTDPPAWLAHQAAMHGQAQSQARSNPGYAGLAHPPFFVRLPKHLPKPVPDLLIRGFVAGQPVAELRMSAHPGGDALAMVADDATLFADGSDATRVVFRAIDAFGNQRRHGSGQVALTLSGPAMLLGDNPFEFGEYGGLGAVWIRSLAGQPGAITLTASHPLLGQAEVQVRSAAVKNTSELG